MVPTSKFTLGAWMVILALSIVTSLRNTQRTTVIEKNKKDAVSITAHLKR
jgi:hypothetical protein